MLPRGLVSVLQTPFSPDYSVDLNGLSSLTGHAIGSGANGLLVPAVASEAPYLSFEEKREILSTVASTVQGRVPLMVGASADNPVEILQLASFAEKIKASSYLVALPPALSEAPADEIISFLEQITPHCDLPLIIQDLDWNGPGLPLSVIAKLRERIPSFQGLKIETLPAGPKYTAVKEELGSDFYVSGGWAVTQLIEALDRGVDAMIPESSMVPVYNKIHEAYNKGNRAEAVTIFRRLIPILSFTNQEITLSIAFFKKLLVRKEIFTSEVLRHPGFAWDDFNSRLADELVSYYLELEAEVTAGTDS